MEYIILGIAFIVVLGLVFFLFNKLTPNNWSNLRGGLATTYSKTRLIAIIVVVVVFAVLFSYFYFF